METTRLILREYTQDDLESIHQYSGDPEVLRYMLWGPNSRNDTLEFIEMCINESTEKPRRIYNFAIQLKETGELIGGISLSLHHDEGEIGWILNKRFWRQSYGTEAAQAMIRFGFESLNLNTITATCDAENTGSYRIMIKCGMTQTAFQVETRLSSYFGSMRDQRVFEISRAMYLDNQSLTSKAG